MSLNILFILSSSIAIYVGSICIHFFILKRSKGAYQQKEWNSFCEIIDQYGPTLFFNINVVPTMINVIIDQQRMFSKTRKIKAESEEGLRKSVLFLSRITLREKLGEQLNEKDIKTREMATNNILVHQSDLLYLKEELGFDSEYLEGLSAERFEQLRKMNVSR